MINNFKQNYMGATNIEGNYSFGRKGFRASSKDYIRFPQHSH